jgi:hypothetical protein
MAELVKRRYDNSRRQAQARATRVKVIKAANRLFTEHGYPATTIEAIAEASDTPGGGPDRRGGRFQTCHYMPQVRHFHDQVILYMHAMNRGP